MCAAAEPADDAAAALHEQKQGASREADAARRRPSRAADATATLRCVCNGLCAARCVMCVGQAAAHVLCLVDPGGTCAVSGRSRDVRGTQPSVSVWCIDIYLYIYIYIYIYTLCQKIDPAIHDSFGYFFLNG